MKKDFRQSSKRGAIAWLLQRISAAVLFMLLLFHFIIYHFVSQGKPVSYEQVVARMSSWWFPVVQCLFLICALYHGLNGAWNVTEDYVQSHWGRLLLHGLILVAGAVLFFVGMLNVVQAAMLKIA